MKTLRNVFNSSADYVSDFRDYNFIGNVSFDIRAPVTNSAHVHTFDIRKIRDISVGVSRNRARLNDKLLIISHFTAKCLISKS